MAFIRARKGKKGKSWVIVDKAHGLHITLGPEVRTRAQARAELEEYSASVLAAKKAAEGTVIVPRVRMSHRMPAQDAFDAYMDEIRHNSAEATVVLKARAWTQFSAHCDPAHVEDITIKAVLAWKAEYRHSNTTFNIRFRDLRAMYNWWMKRGFAKGPNPFTEIGAKPVGKISADFHQRRDMLNLLRAVAVDYPSRRNRIELNLDPVKASYCCGECEGDFAVDDVIVFTKLGEPESALCFPCAQLKMTEPMYNCYVVVLLAGWAGMRLKEITCARWEWMRFHAQPMIDIRGHAEFQIKNRKEHSVPMNYRIRQALEPSRQASGYVLSGLRIWNGKAAYRVNPRKRLLANLDALNLPKNDPFHKLRRSFVTHQLNGDPVRGVMPKPAKQIAAWIGDTVQVVMDHYQGVNEYDPSIDAF